MLKGEIKIKKLKRKTNKNIILMNSIIYRGRGTTKTLLFLFFVNFHLF
jgi:hypothetical protein